MTDDPRLPDEDERVRFPAQDMLKFDLVRIVDTLGLERTERYLARIRESLPYGRDLSWAGQTLATQVLREWINSHDVKYVTPNEGWDKAGEIIRAYLTGKR